MDERVTEAEGELRLDGDQLDDAAALEHVEFGWSHIGAMPDHRSQKPGLKTAADNRGNPGDLPDLRRQRIYT